MHGEAAAAAAVEPLSWRGETTYSVTFFSANIAGGLTASSTWSLCSAGAGSGSNRTIASIGVALLPTRFCYMMGRLVCSCALQRKTLEITMKDLDNIAAAAERITREHSNGLLVGSSLG